MRNKCGVCCRAVRLSVSRDPLSCRNGLFCRRNYENMNYENNEFYIVI